MPSGASTRFNIASTQFVNVSDPSVVPTANLTICFRYKRVTASVQTAFSQWAASNQAWVLQHHTDNRLYWIVSSTGANLIYRWTPSGDTNTNWNTIVGTYDGGAGTLLLYYNGATTGSLVGVVPASLYNSTAEVASRYSGANYPNAFYSDMRCYNRTFTADEVLAYHYGEFVNPKNLYLHWSGINNNFRDLSGNGNHGTSTGTGDGEAPPRLHHPGGARLVMPSAGAVPPASGNPLRMMMGVGV